jgi:hypothetical protein
MNEYLKQQLVTEHPKCAIVTINKELVDALLALNTRNRAIKPSVIAAYRRYIANGQWSLTNQGIGISSSGFVIDGQQRLYALQAEGYPPVKILLVTGLSEDAIAAVDSGSNRTPRDYLHFFFDKKVSAFTTAILRTIMLSHEDFRVIRF